MSKAGKVGAWFAIVGLALAMQGCWDEQEDRLSLLGEGGCRTADGGEGEHGVVGVTSAEECEAQCFAGEQPCTAVEYNANTGNCEIHHEPIAKFEQVDGVRCYAMR